MAPSTYSGIPLRKRWEESKRGTIWGCRRKLEPNKVQKESVVECDGINVENTEKPKFHNNIVCKFSVSSMIPIIFLW